MYPKNTYELDAGIGLNKETVGRISDLKAESPLLRRYRQQALGRYEQTRMPLHWAPEAIREIDFQSFRYYTAPANDNGEGVSWEGLQLPIRRRLADIGVAEEDKAGHLGGFRAQLNGESVYARLREELEDQGIIFVDPSEGLNRYGDLFRKWYGRVVPAADSVLSALNAAVFSGGNFIYIPPGVKVKRPLKGFLHLEGAHCGQFGRSLIIADEGAEVTFIESCTSARSNGPNLHASVGELVALPGAKIQYVSIQNWSPNVYNLVTLRGWAYEDAEIRWIDANIGGRLTMKYPGIILKEPGARGEMLSIAVAANGQYQDTGAKMMHAADNTKSTITSKSISKGTGRADYRGWVKVDPLRRRCTNHTECDALLIDSNSRTDTYPAISVTGGNGNSFEHEATVTRISAEQLFYMRQRGLSAQEALSLSVNGFVNDLIRAFPVEYSTQLKRLIELEMEGTVG